MKDKLLIILVGFLAAVVVDLRRYRLAKKENPAAEFDWLLAATTWIEGALTGIAGAVVQGAAG